MVRRELLIYAAIAPLIYVAVRHIGVVTLVILSVLWCLDSDPKRFIFVSRGILFFSVGAYLAISKRSIQFTTLRPYRWALLLLWCVLVFLKSGLALKYGGSWAVIHNASVFVGLLAMWLLHEDFPRALRCILKRLAPYTFFVFAVHMNALDVAWKLWLRAWGGRSDVGDVAFYLIGPLLVLCSSVAIARLFKQVCPRGYALATGWR